MTNRDTGKASTGNGGADLGDVADKVRWLSSDTGLVDDASWRDAVEILGSNTDTGNTAGEGSAVCSNGSLQCSDLVCDCGLASGSPQTEKKCDIVRNGCRNGRGWGVGGSLFLGDV